MRRRDTDLISIPDHSNIREAMTKEEVTTRVKTKHLLLRTPLLKASRKGVVANHCEFR
jgi:hypothetical protein